MESFRVSNGLNFQTQTQSEREREKERESERARQRAVMEGRDVCVCVCCVLREAGMFIRAHCSHRKDAILSEPDNELLTGQEKREDRGGGGDWRRREG